MPSDTLSVALVHDVFLGVDASTRLKVALRNARDAGAEFAVLPELPAQAWSPATKHALEADAEPPEGPRHALLSTAACTAHLGLVGGAIVCDPETGRRHNTALVFDARGALRASYRKIHLPNEPGFWESHHYHPGEQPPTLVTAFSMPLGIQLCSDVQRPTGMQLLAALGAELIVAPRATPVTSYERWKLVLRAGAVASASYVVSVNRPAPEADVPLGGASLAIAPDGEVLAEVTEPLAILELSRVRVQRARRDYPGYLSRPAGLYAEAWRRVAKGS